MSLFDEMSCSLSSDDRTDDFRCTSITKHSSHCRKSKAAKKAKKAAAASASAKTNRTLVDLWKKEYELANKELTKIRSEFFILKSRSAMQSDELLKKDVQVMKLEKRLAEMARKSDCDEKQINYWFEKTNALKREKKEERRQSVQLLDAQKAIDDQKAAKQQATTKKWQSKFRRSALENEVMRAKNQRVLAMMRELTGDLPSKSGDLKAMLGNDGDCCESDELDANYLAHTRSSQLKTRAGAISSSIKSKLIKEHGELNNLLSEIEQDFGNHRSRSDFDHSELLMKTQLARKKGDAIKKAIRSSVSGNANVNVFTSVV